MVPARATISLLWMLLGWTLYQAAGSSQLIFLSALSMTLSDSLSLWNKWNSGILSLLLAEQEAYRECGSPLPGVSPLCLYYARVGRAAGAANKFQFPQFSTQTGVCDAYFRKSPTKRGNKLQWPSLPAQPALISHHTVGASSAAALAAVAAKRSSSVPHRRPASRSLSCCPGRLGVGRE